jgi:hypothetical protein
MATPNASITTTTTTTTTTTVSFNEVVEGNEDVFFENLAKFTLDNLEKARDTLGELMKGLNGVERSKVAYVKEQTEKFIEQLQKSKKAGVLGKVFKALGIVGTILAGLAAVLCPSPMTIAMFTVALVMTMEPLLADAAGYDSLIEKGMGEMMKGLSELFGSVGGAIAGALIILLLMAAATVALAGGVSALSSAIGNTGSATAQFVAKMPTLLRGMISGELTEAQRVAIFRVLESTEACITVAQGGVQIAQAELNLAVAKLMYAFQVDQAIIDLIDSLTKSITQDATAYQEHINRLLELLPQFFAPLNA